MKRKKRPLASWDECEIAVAEIRYRLEEDPSLDEETVRNQVYEDSDVFELEWESVTEHLTEILNEKNPSGYWYASVVGFGWRKLNGRAFIKAKDGVEFLRKLLPNTDCTWYLYRDGRGFKLNNFHHDAPTGEWYFFHPATKKQMETEDFR